MQQLTSLVSMISLQYITTLVFNTIKSWTLTIGIDCWSWWLKAQKIVILITFQSLWLVRMLIPKTKRYLTSENNTLLLITTVAIKQTVFHSELHIYACQWSDLPSFNSCRIMSDSVTITMKCWEYCAYFLWLCIFQLSFLELLRSQLGVLCFGLKMSCKVCKLFGKCHKKMFSTNNIW